ncbi:MULTISPECIES: cysteine-rich KTR domain-containing protein [Enterococcus]|uniref:Cysteine-rich KTR domain-containing protein n=1 Tax=Enterococcus alishanensis TaxID=1303817 RepID=A0ABS6TCC4_9ENTE|nr:cysteine-rich KTR domain-containing protein [Enterococcus alishanensis]MBV7390532.1 cysteine-rich KTR domain-containing protein [Enterococcus alishanensis]
MLVKDNWLHCPICKAKTRNKIYANTIVKNFPLFCPRCKGESVVNVKEYQVTVIKEPDAKTQSR